MATPVEKMLDDALSLPADMRAELAERLIDSLNLPTQPEIDVAWAAEAEHRAQEITEGTVETIPGDEVFRELRAKYGR